MHKITFDPHRSVLSSGFNLSWNGQTLLAPACLEEVLKVFNGHHSAEQLGSALGAFPSAFLNLGITRQDLPDAILDAQRVLAERLGQRWLKVATTPTMQAFGARSPDLPD